MISCVVLWGTVEVMKTFLVISVIVDDVLDFIVVASAVNVVLDIVVDFVVKVVFIVRIVVDISCCDVVVVSVFLLFTQ